MIIYIAGKIAGKFNYAEKFRGVEEQLKKARHVVLTPLCFPLGLSYDDYMHLAYAMIEVADAVVMLDNFCESKGAQMEFNYAKKKGKTIYGQNGLVLSHKDMHIGGDE